MQMQTPETIEIMNERFGHDCLIALATCDNNIPSVRTVNSYYENGAFYIITYALSEKIKQIEKNPDVAISGEWFSSHGKAVNMGYFCKDENKEIADKLRKAFSEWIDNGHNDFKDINTCILRVFLTHGTLLSKGKKYSINFLLR